MKRRSPRRRGWLAAAVVATLAVAAGTPLWHSPDAGAAVTQHDSASIGREKNNSDA